MLQLFQVYGSVNGGNFGIKDLMMTKELKKKRNFVTTYWKETMIRELTNGAVTKVYIISFINMWRNKWYRGVSHNIKT